MGILDDTAIFAAVIQQGGFSHAARHLGLSNGMVSRRIAQLEADLGVTLLKRTTRQVQLTPEGEVFWRHAQRIQQEMDAALNVIQSSRDKPKGRIRISAPVFFGANYLMPIIQQFNQDYPDIEVDLVLANQQVDPVRQQLDFVIRGSGYLDNKGLKDSSMRVKLLLKENIHLYASMNYLLQNGQPTLVDDLLEHKIIGYSELDVPVKEEKWVYAHNRQEHEITLRTVFNCNDVATRLAACCSGMGIARFTDLNIQPAAQQAHLHRVLTEYSWGDYHLYAVYPQQKSLPARTRLLLDFVAAQTQHLQNKINNK